MSRDLLKRVADELDIDRDNWGHLCEEIETYLAQPDEPVAWRCDPCREIGVIHCAHPEECGHMKPLYTSPPDQSARIAELSADGVRLMETITDLRQQLAALQAKLDGGVRVKAQLDEDKDYFADNWSFPFNATLILDEGVEI